MASLEYQLQTYAVRYLNGEIKKGRTVIRVNKPFPEVTFWHCYNGRTKEDGFFLRELGVLAGVYDLHFIWPGHYGVAEAKATTGLSDHQKNFRSKILECGHKEGVFKTVEQLRDLLISWGLTCRNPHVLEPPRPIEEQRKALHAFYGRTNTHVKTVAEVIQEAREE